MTPVQSALLCLLLPAAFALLACVARHPDVKFVLLVMAAGALVACFLNLIEVAA